MGCICSWFRPWGLKYQSGCAWQLDHYVCSKRRRSFRWLILPLIVLNIFRGVADANTAAWIFFWFWETASQKLTRCCRPGRSFFLISAETRDSRTDDTAWTFLFHVSPPQSKKTFLVQSLWRLRHFSVPRNKKHWRQRRGREISALADNVFFLQHKV